MSGFAALALLVSFQPEARAVLANAWHIPDNSGDLGFTMRNPEFEIGTNTAVTVYSGIQKLNNSYGTANQTGGWVIYKGATQSSWSSNALSFYLNGGPSPNNQYWSASFNTTNFGTDEVIQYYLCLTFDGVNGVQNTYVYGGDGTSLDHRQPVRRRRRSVHHPQPARVAVSRRQSRVVTGKANGTVPTSASGSKSATSARTVA